ncbi:hypothetical protein AAF712_005226 [Marasmius tenuissimus]|uniref:Uncharacterized protein n=1 Tax=Marasmius tenuissimus TaxID=585030 RepID=A0ABR3A368_9AGAR
MPKSRRLLFKDRFPDLCNPALVSLLNDPKCTLGPFITALQAGYSKSAYPRRVPHDELAQTIIDHCANLTSLKTPLPHSILPLLINISSSLTHLDIAYELDDFDDIVSIQAIELLELIGNFSALEILSLCCPPGLLRRSRQRHYCPSPIPVSTDSKIPPLILAHLRHLKMELEWDVFIPWFLIPNGVKFPALETLGITFSDWHAPMSTKILESFFDLSSSAVKRVSLTATWDSAIPGKISFTQTYHICIDDDLRAHAGL